MVCLEVASTLVSGRLENESLLNFAFYASLLGFVRQPTTAALLAMVICSVHAMLFASGEPLLSIAFAAGMVAATCSLPVILLQVLLVGALTTDVLLSSAAVTSGTAYVITAITVIMLLLGMSFRIGAARESVLIAERKQVIQTLETISREAQERIADELHDGIAHDLTLILFHARALPKQADEAARHTSLTTIEASAQAALGSIKTLLSSIQDTAPRRSSHEHPSTAYDRTIGESIHDFSLLLSNAGITTHTMVANPAPSMPGAVEHALRQAALEAVTNVIKHAPSSRSATIELHEQNGVITLTITNTWSGTRHENEVTSGSGRGLVRARERANAVHGTLETQQTPSSWILRVTAPSRPDQDDPT